MMARIMMGLEQLMLSRVNSLWVWLVLTSAVTYYVYYLWYRLISRQGLPSSVPWAKTSHNVWHRAKLSLTSLFDLRSHLIEGYEKYSKANKPFILPNIVTGHEIILPMSQMRWLLDQPDDVLSQHDFNKAFLAADFTMLHHKIIGEANMGDFIRRNLTRELDVFAGPLVDEIEQALGDLWGRDTTRYQDISVYNVMLEIIGRLVNRVFVGPVLCRDPRYLQSSTAFAQYAIVWGGIISLFPTWLRPLVAPFWTVYDRFQYWKLRSVLGKIVRDRIRTFEASMALGKPNQTQPNDYIHWALVEAFRTGDPSEQTVDMITKRLAVMTFAAVQSSAITITNALFDIASSSESTTIQEALRVEAIHTGIGTPTPNPRAWARSSLAQMSFTDSLLRESLRLWSFVSHGVTKVIKAPAGVTLPSGEHLPQGTKCGIASYGPQRDAQVYSDPNTWNPFRFCPDVETLNEIKVAAPRSFVTTSDYLMGFSHGRHACQQLKLLLAHIAQHYDIEPIDARPINRWLNNSIGPPIGATLRVRRRTKTSMSVDVAVEMEKEDQSLKTITIAANQFKGKVLRPGAVPPVRSKSEEVRALC